MYRNIWFLRVSEKVARIIMDQFYIINRGLDEENAKDDFVATEGWFNGGIRDGEHYFHIKSRGKSISVKHKRGLILTLLLTL